jgi:hypothetical protein|tara:strand:- start:1040 stop:1450 length:411 start_codon:yes stop_codon:yes gene_type:complete
MNNDEILLLQNYLRDIFDNEEITIRKNSDSINIANFFIGTELLGYLNKDDDIDEDDVSYSLTISIDSPIDNTKELEKKIQNISKLKKIRISTRGVIEDSKEVSIISGEDEEEFLGVVFEDNDASCTFSMSILDFDL